MARNPKSRNHLIVEGAALNPVRSKTQESQVLHSTLLGFTIVASPVQHSPNLLHESLAFFLVRVHRRECRISKSGTMCCSQGSG